jgi:hypothetical protein
MRQQPAQGFELGGLVQESFGSQADGQAAIGLDSVIGYYVE